MKTNHQRGFVATLSSQGEKRKHVRFALSGKGLNISKAQTPDGEIKLVMAKGFIDPDAGQSKKEMRHQKAGAKKFIRSRTRAFENRELDKVVRSL